MFYWWSGFVSVKRWEGKDGTTGTVKYLYAEVGRGQHTMVCHFHSSNVYIGIVMGTKREE